MRRIAHLREHTTVPTLAFTTPMVVIARIAFSRVGLAWRLLKHEHINTVLQTCQPFQVYDRTAGRAGFVPGTVWHAQVL